MPIASHGEYCEHIWDVEVSLPVGTLYRQESVGGVAREHDCQLTEYQVPVLVSEAPAIRNVKRIMGLATYRSPQCGQQCVSLVSWDIAG